MENQQRGKKRKWRKKKRKKQQKTKPKITIDGMAKGGKAWHALWAKRGRGRHGRKKEGREGEGGKRWKTEGYSRRSQQLAGSKTQGYQRISQSRYLEDGRSRRRITQLLTPTKMQRNGRPCRWRFQRRWTAHSPALERWKVMIPGVFQHLARRRFKGYDLIFLQIAPCLGMKCHGCEPFVGHDVADDGNADNNLSGKRI